MRIAVIDGQGGGIGRNLILSLRKSLKDDVNIIALGTNALATSAMMKAGADEGATGENAISFMAHKVDLIVGPIGIVVGNSMLGELTPAMAEAVGSSPCQKILIPVQKCSVKIAGSEDKALHTLIDDLVRQVKDLLSS